MPKVKTTEETESGKRKKRIMLGAGIGGGLLGLGGGLAGVAAGSSGAGTHGALLGGLGLAGGALVGGLSGGGVAGMVDGFTPVSEKTEARLQAEQDALPTELEQTSRQLGGVSRRRANARLNSVLTSAIGLPAGGLYGGLMASRLGGNPLVGAAAGGLLGATSGITSVGNIASDLTPKFVYDAMAHLHKTPIKKSAVRVNSVTNQQKQASYEDVGGLGGGLAGAGIGAGAGLLARGALNGLFRGKLKGLPGGAPTSILTKAQSNALRYKELARQATATLAPGAGAFAGYGVGSTAGGAVARQLDGKKTAGERDKSATTSLRAEKRAAIAYQQHVVRRHVLNHLTKQSAEAMVRLSPLIYALLKSASVVEAVGRACPGSTPAQRAQATLALVKTAGLL